MLLGGPIILIQGYRMSGREFPLCSLYINPSGASDITSLDGYFSFPSQSRTHRRCRYPRSRISQCQHYWLLNAGERYFQGRQTTLCQAKHAPFSSSFLTCLRWASPRWREPSLSALPISIGVGKAPLFVDELPCVPTPAFQIALSTFNAIQAYSSHESVWLFKTSIQTGYLRPSTNRSPFSPSCISGKPSERLLKSARYLDSGCCCFSFRRGLRERLTWPTGRNFLLTWALNLSHVFGTAPVETTLHHQIATEFFM